MYEDIKLAVDIIDAARQYGMDVDGHGKALCPFHGEKTPSLSFKSGRFKCFGCGAGGDVIDLVAGLCGISGAEAAKRLRAGCGLAGKPTQAYAEYRRQQRIKANFKAWDKRAFNSVLEYERRLKADYAQYKPSPGDTELRPEFKRALDELPLVTELLDVLTTGDESEKLELYVNWREWIDGLQRLAG